MATLGLASCASDGGLDQADFDGECTEEAGCGTNLDEGPLAIGGTLEVAARLTVPGAGTPAISLITADESVIEIDGNQVTGVGEGMSAVLLLDASGTVLDFIHVHVELPDHLRITRVGGDFGGTDIDGPIELLVGDEIVVGRRPALGAQLMIGEAPSQWIADSSAVSILADGEPTRRRIVARELGASTITVSSMGLERTIAINVLP